MPIILSSDWSRGEPRGDTKAIQSLYENAWPIPLGNLPYNAGITRG